MPQHPNNPPEAGGKPEPTSDLDAAVEALASNFDVHSRTFADNIPAIYEPVRQRCPVAHSSDYGGYDVFLRFEDVRSSAKNWQQFSSVNEEESPDRWREGLYIPGAPVRQGMAEMDPPLHAEVRRKVTDWIAPTVVDKFEPRVREVAVEQIELALEKGEFDVVDDLASPFPARLTVELMGLPPEDWPIYLDPQHEQTFIVQGTPEFAPVAEKIKFAQGKMREHVAERRRNPGDDLASTLIETEFGGERLSDQRIVDILWQVMGGGFDTVGTTISYAMKHMTEDPKLREYLIEDFSRIPKAVEEMVRYYTPQTGLARTVTESTELGGKQYEKGDRVFVCWGAANFDPEVFEEPLEFNPERSPNPHVGFGFGVHKCVGARFARVELRVFFEELLTRMPDFVVHENAWKPAGTSVAVINTFEKMPASATSTAAKQQAGASA